MCVVSRSFLPVTVSSYLSGFACSSTDPMMANLVVMMMMMMMMIQILPMVELLK